MILDFFFIIIISRCLLWIALFYFFPHFPNMYIKEVGSCSSASWKDEHEFHLRDKLVVVLAAGLAPGPVAHAVTVQDIWSSEVSLTRARCRTTSGDANI